MAQWIIAGLLLAILIALSVIAWVLEQIFVFMQTSLPLRGFGAEATGHLHNIAENMRRIAR